MYFKNGFGILINTFHISIYDWTVVNTTLLKLSHRTVFRACLMYATSSSGYEEPFWEREEEGRAEKD